jgi:hypothetical protein
MWLYCLKLLYAQASSTAKHEREMQGRANIAVVDHYKYKPRNNYIYIYICKQNLDTYHMKKKTCSCMHHHVKK